MVVAGYDKRKINHQLALSIPFAEATGQYPMDRALPHHGLSGHNLAWVTLASHLGVVSLDGATAYIDALAADTVDLDITTEDYSLVGWIYYQASALSQLVIGRYGVDLDGWELYTYSINETLNLRHHHVSLAPDTRSGCYSVGWAVDTWHLFGVSRSGAYPKMYHNGVEVEVTYDVGGLNDPDSCNRDLVIGTRYTKNTNWYKGYKKWYRAWPGRSLENWEHRQIFEMERHWFGV